MKWFIARFVYQVIIGIGNHIPQFDEQWRLIRADELEWAKEKATILGRLGECSFVNERQETVTWKFISAVDICPIGLEDGAEIYSFTKEPKDVIDYLQTLKARANQSITSF
jgi:hypothetical protein